MRVKSQEARVEKRTRSRFGQTGHNKKLDFNLTLIIQVQSVHK